MPELLQHIDAVFPALWVRWMFPVTSKILLYSPFKAARKFLKASDDFQKVSKSKRCYATLVDFFPVLCSCVQEVPGIFRSQRSSRSYCEDG
jgi:hypothetical protein